MTNDKYGIEDIDLLAQKIWDCYKGERLIVGISGIPGSGKSTVTSLLVPKLADKVSVKILPQDGYHYYLKELKQFEDPEEALKRRGAPFTFNVDKLLLTVQDVKDGKSVWVPTFDHKFKDPIEDQIHITDEKVIILEGNYFNLNAPKWSEINKLIDKNWLIVTDFEISKSRLVKRHLEAGISTNEEEAVKRVESNDLVNAKLILDNMIREPDLIIYN